MSAGRWSLLPGSLILGAFLSVATIAQPQVTTTRLENIRMCTQFSGATAGNKIAACIADLPPSGGTADARGLEGAQTLGTLTISTSNVALLLGGGTYTGSVVITGSHNAVRGLGRRATNLTATTNTVVIRNSSYNAISGLTITSTARNSVPVLLQSNGGAANHNIFDQVEIQGPGRGATSSTNTTKCMHFDSSTVAGPVYFNQVINSFVLGCNILFQLDATDSNANRFTNNTLEAYWKAFNIAGVENIARGNFLNQANGASVKDPSIVYNLTAGAAFNDLEIPTGEPGPMNNQAVAVAPGVTNNKFSNICSLNYPLGLYQAGDATLGNSGTANPGLDAPDCYRWLYRYSGLRENTTYRATSFNMPFSNKRADIVLQYDGNNAATQCTSAGLVHGTIQTDNAGTVTATPIDVTQQSTGSGCPSFSGWDISGKTIYPVFFNTSNGTTSTATSLTIIGMSSAFGGPMGNSLSSISTGYSAPTIAVTGNVNTAQGKGHLSAAASLDYAAWAGNDCQDLTITVPGAGNGDPVYLGVPAALSSTADVQFTGFVSAPNTVTARGCKVTPGGSANPAATTVRADVWKY